MRSRFPASTPSRCWKSSALNSPGSPDVPQTDEKAFETYVETILREKSRLQSGDLAEWDEARALFPKNRLTVTRQVPCHPGKHDTVDMVFALNGLPVATCELKNPGTGQNWRHARKQYQEDRDPQAPLFKFKTRAVVHFAADPDEIHMTTRLRRAGTHFLPFNRGSHPGEVQCGAGNPQHPSGYRTGYFWEEILQRDTFLDVLGHFMFIEKKEEKVDDGKGGKKRAVKE